MLNKVPADTVGHGEDEVGEARDCLGSCCELLYLDGVLASNHLDRLLDNQAVCIISDLHEACACGLEVEVCEDIVSFSNYVLVENLCGKGLEIAVGRGVSCCEL